MPLTHTYICITKTRLGKFVVTPIQLCENLNTDSQTHYPRAQDFTHSIAGTASESAATLSTRTEALSINHAYKCEGYAIYYTPNCT